MTKEKVKAVRFSPSGEPLDSLSSAADSTTQESIRSILVSKETNKQKRSSHTSKKLKCKNSDSPLDCLATEVALPTSDGIPENHLLQDVQPPAKVNYFSASKETDIRESHPDKPSLYDSYCREPVYPQSPKPELLSFVDVVKPGGTKYVDEPVALRTITPLCDLIKDLEIEHFGKELGELNRDEMFSLRSESELKDLTDRLHAYVKRMRELRTGGVHLDSSAFFKSVDAMEKEMLNLKNTYEKEISKLRSQLEDSNKAKNHFELRSEKLEGVASDLQSRIALEIQKNQKLVGELNVVQRSVNQKEAELQQLVQKSLEIKDSVSVEATARKLEQSERETMDMHRRCESEVLQRREAEERCHQLQQRIDFNERLSKQTQQDLQDRLASASTVILNLEGRMRTINQPDHDQHIAEMMAGVRDIAEKELYKFKQDAEERFGQNITILKAQLDADRKSFEGVATENRKLLKTIEELNAKIGNLQRELLNMEHSKRSIEESVVMERNRALLHIQATESKFKDLQEMLLEKMKELNAARCLNVPLKVEVENLRALLEEEEKRFAMDMRLPPLFPSPVHVNTASTALPVMQAATPIATANPIPSAPSPVNIFTPGEAIDTFPTDREQSTDTEAQTMQSVRMNIRPSSPARVGPIRAKSAPCRSDAAKVNGKAAETNVEYNGEGKELGQGKDYFDDMFKDEEGRPKSAMKVRPESAKSATRPGSVMSHDYNHCTNSATSDIRIHEVHADGRCIVLVNTSDSKDVDFGGYLLQQNVGGNPVAVYRFPPRVLFKAKTYISVYSGKNDPILHQPPTQFVWKEQERWGTGPECTTILCKPNGQAIAWTTAAHRFGGVQFTDTVESSSPTGMESELPTFDKHVNGPKTEPVYLKREKQTPPSLTAEKHPFGTSTDQDTHPLVSKSRPLEFGNDNSSNQRQSRSQSQRPDPVPGEPYAGAAGQRMGSAPLRRYTPLNSASGNVRKNGSITNKPDGTIRFGSASPFLSPLQQEYARAVGNGSTSLTASVHFTS